MPTDLTDINISDSYKGLIHACGSCLPALANQQVLYDGAGQKSSISIGLEGQGVSISGQLSAGAFSYPALPSTNGYVLAQVNSTTIALTSVSDILRSASSNYIPDGTYTNVQNITVKNGLITSVQSTTAVRTFFCDLETFNEIALSAIKVDGTIGTRGIYPYGVGALSSVTSNNVKPILIRDNYLKKIWGSATNNGGTQPMYGVPNIGDVAIVIFSDPTVLGFKIPSVPTPAVGNPTGGDLTYVTNPQMWGIKYVWRGSNWTWERYLAASGPLSYQAVNRYTSTDRWARTFQVNNQFSSNGDGQPFGILSIQADTGTLKIAADLKT